jgi:hypothetical protein
MPLSKNEAETQHGIQCGRVEQNRGMVPISLVLLTSVDMQRVRVGKIITLYSLRSPGQLKVFYSTNVRHTVSIQG